MVLGRASVISPSISIFSSLPMRRSAYPKPAQPRTRRGRSLAPSRVPTPPAVWAAPLTRVRGRLQLGEQGAELGTGLDPEHGGELVAVHEGLRRAFAAPLERRRAQHPPPRAAAPGATPPPPQASAAGR